MTTNILLRSISRFYSHAYSIKLYPTKQILSLHINSIKISRLCSTISCYEDKDPAPLFFDDQVQTVLKKLTGLNFEKVFKKRYLEEPGSAEEMKFLTIEEIKERNEASLIEAKKLLLMPPVMKEREPITEVLSFDPALQGEEQSNIVVTDISFGVSNRDRLIVVREPNGILRQATWEERDRMNFIYNPRPGQWYKAPPIFQDEYVKNILDREEYVFLLDFACVQFEPDDPLFYKVTRSAYEHIRKGLNFEALHSTRHFGPMCFYFAWTKKIDALVIHYINGERIEEAVDLVRLYYLINDKTKLAAVEETENKLNFIKKYIEEDSKLRSNLELTVQKYEEIVRERESLQKTLKASHGIS